MNKLKIFTFAIIILAVCSSGLYAQRDSSGRKLKKVIREKLVEKIGIDETTADKVITLQTKHRKEIKELRKLQADYLKDITDNPESQDISSKLDAFVDCDNKIYQKRKEFLDDLKSFLTPKQIAQMMSFSKDLSKFMKKEMRNKHRDSDDR